MKYIWAPWRMNYIMNNDPNVECVFCKALQQADSEENLVFFRGLNTFLILNRYPYTSGHIMVVPNQHVPSLEDLTLPGRSEMMEQATQVLRVLRDLYHPDGFNMGINLGEAAGAGIACHVHLHVVPRWAGDTNFMSSVARTRVLPEDIGDSYERIRQGWNRLIAG
jgi:ATP adenylyltransferase